LKLTPQNQFMETEPKNKSPKYSSGSSMMGLGISLGIAIGTAFGVAMHDLAVGVALGAGVGVALGVGLAAKKDKPDSD
jgi:hypothetical protein